MSEEKNTAEYACTRITPNMIINGDITASDNILVEGQVFGNIKTSANITAKNLVIGDIQADSAALDTARIKGDISLTGTLAVNQSSIIVGTVKANALKLDGKVRGNVDIDESALITESALLVGDIVAQFVTTQAGARINGTITTKGSQAPIDIDSEFDFSDVETKTEGGNF